VAAVVVSVVVVVVIVLIGVVVVFLLFTFASELTITLLIVLAVTFLLTFDLGSDLIRVPNWLSIFIISIFTLCYVHSLLIIIFLYLYAYSIPYDTGNSIMTSTVSIGRLHVHASCMSILLTRRLLSQVSLPRRVHNLRLQCRHPLSVPVL
jgi:hypothetical protein